jgi:hypothetical protein
MITEIINIEIGKLYTYIDWNPDDKLFLVPRASYNHYKQEDTFLGDWLGRSLYIHWLKFEFAVLWDD